MYNLGKYDYTDLVVFEEIERQMGKHKNNFDSRQSFGCVYGLYRSNSGSKIGLDFFEEELIRNLDQLSKEN